MAIINSLGIGSGLDLSSLVSDLVSSEKQPVTDLLDCQQASYEAEFSAMDALISQLTATSDFLTQQLTALPGFTRENN